MSFTLHDIDDELNNRLSERARLAGVSKNRFVKELLSQAMGLPTQDGYPDDYSEFCGLWSQTELAEFERSQESNTTVDPEDWA